MLACFIPFGVLSGNPASLSSRSESLGGCPVHRATSMGCDVEGLLRVWPTYMSTSAGYKKAVHQAMRSAPRLLGISLAGSGKKPNFESRDIKFSGNWKNLARWRIWGIPFLRFRCLFFTFFSLFKRNQVPPLFLEKNSKTN